MKLVLGALRLGLFSLRDNARFNCDIHQWINILEKELRHFYSAYLQEKGSFM